MRTLISICLLVTGYVATVLPARAADDGFDPLFNGRDFSGWTNVNVAPNTFTVRDGIIVSTGKPTGVMRTLRMYENFIAELEWKHLEEGGNAGFFIYSSPVTAVGQPFTKGVEIQIINRDHPEGIATRHGDVFPIHGATFIPDRSHPRGWMRCLPSEMRARPTGEWNHYRVESRDGRITLAVNGKIVSGGSNCVPRKGYICLESEGSPCHFRNIRIRELPSSNPPANEVAEEDEGFVSIYTGIDLSGWRGEAGHRGHWQPKDWILEYDGRSEAPDKTLWSERSYRDFELIVDWRRSGDSSVASRNDANGLHLRGKVHIPFGPADAIKPRNQWNRFHVTLRGDRLTVRLNDRLVSEKTLSGVSVEGPLGLRHDGGAIQFANIYVKELQ